MGQPGRPTGPRRRPGAAALGRQVGPARLLAGVHRVYDRLWEAYPLDKQSHAFATLLGRAGSPDAHRRALEWGRSDEFLRIQEYVRNQVFFSRKKDYDDPFRRITFENEAEMPAVIGSPESNGFVRHVRQETEALCGFLPGNRRSRGEGF